MTAQGDLQLLEAALQQIDAVQQGGLELLEVLASREPAGQVASQVASIAAATAGTLQSLGSNSARLQQLLPELNSQAPTSALPAAEAQIAKKRKVDESLVQDGKPTAASSLAAGTAGLAGAPQHLQLPSKRLRTAQERQKDAEVLVQIAAKVAQITCLDIHAADSEGARLDARSAEDASEVRLLCPGVLRAVVALAGPGQPEALRVVLYSPDSDINSKGAWSISERLIFRRITALATLDATRTFPELATSKGESKKQPPVAQAAAVQEPMQSTLRTLLQGMQAGQANVVEGADKALVQDLLQKAWQEDALDALQLVAQLRDVRRGKADIKSFHHCAMWLLENHPLTLLANLEEIVKVGYWKDLLLLLDRSCMGEEEWAGREQAAAHRMANKGANHWPRKHAKKARLAAWRERLNAPGLTKAAKAKLREEQAAGFAQRQVQQIEEAMRLRREKRLANSERARQRLTSGPKYRFLHMTVAAMFASQLQKELAAFKAGKKHTTLAGKWAPTPTGSHDRLTLISTAVAQLLYPASEHQRPGEADSAFAQRIREQYHREYLAPLRQHIAVPEVYMSAGKWDVLPYERVPSVCMKNNKKNFEYHDKQRFEEFLGQVRAGEKKIASGALKPHDLVHEVMEHVGCSWGMSRTASAAALETVELQWRSYVDKLKAGGCLSSAMAVCDVSGSMSGQPMEVAIALSLLVSEVTAPPFNQLICTFSASPELHHVKGSSLAEKVADVAGMSWSMNTNFDAVFELLLACALAVKLPPEDMVKTLFVFSDMEFDDATQQHSNRYTYTLGGQMPYRAPKQTNHEAVKSRFKAAGYDLPRIVYWNLTSRERLTHDTTPSVPVTVTEEGTALVSGFSGQLLRIFMDSGMTDYKELTPMSVMLSAIKKAHRYDNWVVM
ncbi:hypothetical protein WJX72_004438 [[Myrmecia] bisecta]|uniref:Uncharacterized protein n=1 Tax=[Myrmecia] bisecta TaxID=41462 RepID=A0AAW1R6W0_9CHLO